MVMIGTPSESAQNMNEVYVNRKMNEFFGGGQSRGAAASTNDSSGTSEDRHANLTAASL